MTKGVSGTFPGHVFENVIVFTAGGRGGKTGEELVPDLIEFGMVLEGGDGEEDGVDLVEDGNQCHFGPFTARVGTVVVPAAGKWEKNGGGTAHKGCTVGLVMMWLWLLWLLMIMMGSTIGAIEFNCKEVIPDMASFGWDGNKCGEGVELVDEWEGPWHGGG